MVHRRSSDFLYGLLNPPSMDVFFDMEERTMNEAKQSYFLSKKSVINNS